jgi:COP9 signalosome complex subunit 1
MTGITADKNQLLTSVPTAPRAALQTSTLAAAKEYEREARRRIQQMNIHGAELYISGAKRSGLGAMADMGYIDLDSGARELRSGRNVHRSEY